MKFKLILLLTFSTGLAYENFYDELDFHDTKGFQDVEPAFAALDDDQERISLFGTEFDIPDWLANFKTWTSAKVELVKNFFSGDEHVEANVFGQKIRTRIPTSHADARQKVQSMFGDLQRNSTARVMLAVCINVVVFLLIYIVIFFKLMTVSMDEKKMRETKRKAYLSNLESEDLHTYIGQTVISHRKSSVLSFGNPNDENAGPSRISPMPNREDLTFSSDESSSMNPAPQSKD